MFKAPIFSALLLTAFTAWAGARDYNYMPPDDEPVWWTYGTGKNETYDLGIKVKNPCLYGKQITKITMPVNEECDDYTDCKVWLSSELAVDKKGVKSFFTPDIAQWDATVTDGQISVTLPEPYTMTDQPVYVGCTFTSASEKPVKYVVWNPRDRDDDSFWIHTTRTVIQWKSYAQSQGGSLCVNAVLEGDWGQQAVGVDAVATRYPNAPVDAPFSLPFALYAQGTEPATSLDYDYTVDGQTRQGHVELPAPLQADIVNPHTVSLDFGPVSGMGDKTMSVRITAVNSQPNPLDAERTAPMHVQLFVPKHRTLFEEGTGTWCANCPRGLVAIEHLGELYPDRFVALGYHTQDAMTVLPADSIPFQVTGYPCAALDRGPTIDPYYGESRGADFGIEKAFLANNELPAPASVELAAAWTDDTHIHVQATTRFVEDAPQGGYKLSFVLVGNDLYNDSPLDEDPAARLWWQKSYYNDPGQPGILAQLEGRGNPITDWHFNEVVLISKDPKGLEGSLPAQIAAGQEMTCEYDFDIADAVCLTKGAEGPVIRDRDKKNLRVAVVLVAPDGTVANANQASVPSQEPQGPITVSYSNGTQGRDYTFHVGSSATGLAMRLPASKTALLKGRRVTAIEAAVGTRNTAGKQMTLFLGADPTAPQYTQTATLNTMNKWVRHELDTPFEIGDGDLYAGYTLECNAPETNALSADGSRDMPGTTYARSGSEWHDIAGQGHGCANIRLIVDGGDFLDLAVKPMDNQAGYHRAGTQETYSVQVLNFGTRPVDNAHLVAQVGDQEEVEATIDGTLMPGECRDVQFPATEVAEVGKTRVMVALRDGDDDPSDNTAEAEAFFYPADMTRQLLLQGFTGQKCGNCPQGHRDIQTALGKWQGDPVAIVMHHSGFYPDAFTMAEDIDYQSAFHIGGAPMAVINGGEAFSVSYTSVTPALEKAQADEPYARVSLTADYDPATRHLTAHVDVEQINDFPSSPLVNVMLCQNGIEALQSSGGDGYKHDHVFRGTLTGQAWGVALEEGGLDIDTTLPQAIKSTYWDTHDAAAAGVNPTEWTIDPENMYLVAYVAGSDHVVYNCVTAPLYDRSGIAEGVADSHEAARYYDLTGRRVNHPAKGIYIRVQGGKAVKVAL